MAECRNGYIYRNGKCSKRSKNPFKMWGSWIGAVIGFLTPIIAYILGLPHGGSFLNLIEYLAFPVIKPLVSIVGCELARTCGSWVFLVWILYYGILGFLLGWGLTILYRKVFK